MASGCLRARFAVGRTRFLSQVPAVVVLVFVVVVLVLVKMLVLALPLALVLVLVITRLSTFAVVLVQSLCSTKR